jgi:hypothetical protein
VTMAEKTMSEGREILARCGINSWSTAKTQRLIVANGQVAAKRRETPYSYMGPWGHNVALIGVAEDRCSLDCERRTSNTKETDAICMAGGGLRHTAPSTATSSMRAPPQLYETACSVSYLVDDGRGT